ncbi:MAG: hypothetical protein UT84_C0006G0005 [Candidatus Curtissbacteria bacterium GW2011_GWA1_40_16]|uniref:Uncharacterized protein n=1 Tax=Candidatus Curtissbacteria bacterium GW2011_GWA1_40_16 TaxID=1618405 RepID=A0A0G0REF3_9BACT|nr:MAG: hypothetical protein UT84_C0006G0005 [Candidatus Curtissbacteria bacterium GW2011_GWA1_40_16]
MTDTNNVTLRHKLEALIVKDLESQLTQGKITGDRAAEIAELVLDAVPENISHDELLKVIPQLDDKASELASVVFEILSEQDDKHKAEMIEKLRASVRRMVKNG